MERGHSWPQATPTSSHHLVSETTTTVTRTMYVPSEGLDGSNLRHYRQLQTQSMHMVPHCVQSVTLPAPPQTSALTPWHSLDSALAVQGQSPNPEADLPNPAPSIPGFFTEDTKKHALLPIFGMDYIADKAVEVFYISEKPSLPQREDGIIKMPDLDCPGRFQDGFKVDMIGHHIHFERTLRDLPDKTVLCCQRRKKAAFNPTILICAGASIDSSNLVATVRKAGHRKAIVDLEKQGQTEYVIEGDLAQRNYVVKLTATQVAQVSHDDKNARAAVTTRHSYSVQVAPGTDCVLMIAAAMAIEDLYAK